MYALLLSLSLFVCEEDPVYLGTKEEFQEYVSSTDPIGTNMCKQVGEYDGDPLYVFQMEDITCFDADGFLNNRASAKEYERIQDVVWKIIHQSDDPATAQHDLYDYLNGESFNEMTTPPLSDMVDTDLNQSFPINYDPSSFSIEKQEGLECEDMKCIITSPTVKEIRLKANEPKGILYTVGNEVYLDLDDPYGNISIPINLKSYPFTMKVDRSGEYTYELYAGSLLMDTYVIHDELNIQLPKGEYVLKQIDVKEPFIKPNDMNISIPEGTHLDIPILTMPITVSFPEAVRIEMDNTDYQLDNEVLIKLKPSTTYELKRDDEVVQSVLSDVNGMVILSDLDKGSYSIGHVQFVFEGTPLAIMEYGESLLAFNDSGAFYSVLDHDLELISEDFNTTPVHLEFHDKDNGKILPYVYVELDGKTMKADGGTLDIYDLDMEQPYRLKVTEAPIGYEADRDFDFLALPQDISFSLESNVDYL